MIQENKDRNTRVWRLLPGVLLAAGLTAGCSVSDRYPASLRYPLRQDILVKEKPGSELRYLPGPGQLDESIQKLYKEKLGKTLDPADIKGADRKELDEALSGIPDKSTGMFGTPARPTVAVEDPAIDALQLDEGTLRRGSRLYRRNCMHCHGVPGDGRGPTGPWVSPHPRDYRSGKFKFVSTGVDVAGRKPRRADLLRVLQKGIDGTSMPAFGLLPQRELEDLASYVIHLSLRGEVEFDTMDQILSDRASLQDGSIESHVQSRTALFLSRWAEADKTPPNTPKAKYPEEYAKNEQARHESIRRGYKFFMVGEGSCISCHTDFGRQPTYRYDDWGTLVRPANLTMPMYRGGRRPIDFYWRITGGIPPSGMPAAKLPKDEQYWDLVNFVQALPYPGMLPKDIRKNVYGASEGESKAVADAGSR